MSSRGTERVGKALPGAPPTGSRLPSRETHTASPRLPPGQPSHAGTRQSRGPPRPLPACPSELCPSPLPPSPGADGAAQSLRQMAAQPAPGTMSQARVMVRETTLLRAPAPGQQGTRLPPAAVRGAAVMANGRNRAPRPPSRPSGDCWVRGGHGLALSWSHLGLLSGPHLLHGGGGEGWGALSRLPGSSRWNRLDGQAWGEAVGGGVGGGPGRPGEMPGITSVLPLSPNCTPPCRLTLQGARQRVPLSLWV